MVNKSKRKLEKEPIPTSSKKQKGKEKSVDSESEDILESEDDDEIDWETIQLPTEATYNDVEIVMNSTLPKKKSGFELAYDRALRDWINRAHIVCLTAHYKLRNEWCSRPELMSILLSIIPKEVTTCNSIIYASSALYQWWSKYFTITGPGLLTRPKNYFQHLKDEKTLSKVIEKRQSNEESDYIENFSSFLDILSSRTGTRDTSAEFFVAALRACGYEARLVCSLQPVTYKAPPRPSKNQEDQEEEEEESSSILFEYRAPMKQHIDINTILKQSNAKPPTVWAEVFCPKQNHWITVDPIRGIINQPNMMVPQDRFTQLSYILAFDPIDLRGRSNVTDVTFRYTTNITKVTRERERPLTKKEQESGLQLWSDVFLNQLSFFNRLKQRDIQEQKLLSQKIVHTYNRSEAMPSSLGKFQNHTSYALERHLKKFEVIYPKKHIGIIKGEKVYPRDAIKAVTTAEALYKKGRVIKEGEQPIKMVESNPKTIERKRLKERAKQEGQSTLVPCYGEWQTELYVPPPVVDGKIVKTQYGTIDLFVPSMLPKGAVHIPIKGISKIAKQLGIDYADATVGFEYIRSKIVPITNGIVIPEESKQILLELWEEEQQAAIIKAIEKQEKETLSRWRKLIKSLLIKAKVDRDYGKEKNQDDNIWSSYQNDVGGGGGFLPED